jgi:Helix-turn-helix domain
MAVRTQITIAFTFGTLTFASLVSKERKMTPLLSDYMTRAQLAKALKRNTRTIDNWRKEGKGPAPTFIGRHILYRREAIETWLRAQERRAAA